MSDNSPEGDPNAIQETGPAEERSDEAARSHLRAVEEQAVSEPAVQDETRRGSGLVWLLGVALLVCLVLLVMQVQKAGELEAQVETLGAELSVASEALATAEATIGRFELRMDQVRGSVGELLSRVGDLQALVDRDPAADPPGVPLSE